jgi:hypothetical protein
MGFNGIVCWFLALLRIADWLAAMRLRGAMPPIIP